ncbi:MAG: hypothetical protein WDN31_16350 [Hyphomicrobium sp.]
MHKHGRSWLGTGLRLTIANLFGTLASPTPTYKLPVITSVTPALLNTIGLQSVQIDGSSFALLELSL